MCNLHELIQPTIRSAIRPTLCKPRGDDVPIGQQGTLVRSSDGFVIQSSDNKILAVK